MVFALKFLGLAGAAAAVALWETGDCVYALAVAPGLVVMLYATRLRVRRRARERERA